VIIISLSIPADHPAYSGHFPAQPVLPAVVLLDATLHALERAGRGTAGNWEINSAKFQSVVRPGEDLTLQHETLPNGSVRFAIRTADRAVASGTLVPAVRSTAPGVGGLGSFMERNRGSQG
jgi:3-hydroxymyristoyl/3-hydroxydecanoyl-(acyl carrier protein) dehydratase